MRSASATIWPCTGHRRSGLATAGHVHGAAAAGGRVRSTRAKRSEHMVDCSLDAGTRITPDLCPASDSVAERPTGVQATASPLAPPERASDAVLPPQHSKGSRLN